MYVLVQETNTKQKKAPLNLSENIVYKMRAIILLINI